jgi:hypothetical protein
MKRTVMTKIAATVLSLTFLSALGIIGWHANAQSKPQSGFIPPGFLPLGMSINQLMVAIVDDAAHGLWEGGNTDMPLSELEWVEIQMNTFQLEAAATLISLGGTGPADRGWVSRSGRPSPASHGTATASWHPECCPRNRAAETA